MQTTIKGTPASLGKAKGRIRKILSYKDFSKFKQGEILLTKATNPAYTPLIAISLAVITELGGLLCHAAIVSREYGIPAIVGVKDALKVLKDGEIVEVDAGKGEIRKI